jgi:anaphase-promoting complex subunit 4
MVCEVSSPQPRTILHPVCPCLMKLTMTQSLSSDTDAMSTYIALSTPTRPSELHIHRLVHDARVTSLPGSLRSYAVSTMTIPTHKILDAKFADDTTLLALVQSTSEPKTCSLLSLPYTPAPSTSTSTPTSQPNPLLYITLPTANIPTLLLPHGNPIPSSPSSIPTTPPTLTSETLKLYTRHIFEPRFTPLKLVVNGRKGRRVVVVLGSDRKHYRVLDLDYRERKRGVVQGEVGAAGDAVEGSEDDSEWESDSDVEMRGA